MKVCVAQLNPTVGDVEGNLRKASETCFQFKGKADLIVFPELFLVGYPPKDLLERHVFIEKTQDALREVINISVHLSQTGIILGAPLPSERDFGKGLYNSAFLIYQGKILATQSKSLLPTYDVFDETRYFDPAPGVRAVSFKDQTLGISVCEDAWNDPRFWPRKLYSFDPIEALIKKGATLMINISASPFHLGKEKIRFELIRRHASRWGCPFVYVNQIGSNDELIFDGNSMCFDGRGNLIEIFPAFEEKTKIIDLNVSKISISESGDLSPQIDEMASLCQALILGVRDYARKCGFSRALVGLSGGIDSAITCFLAREALGKENVMGVSMPSPYTSENSKNLSKKLAENLGINFSEISISPIYRSYVQTLEVPLELGDEVNVTLENVQARIRGNILMAISNQFGHLLLSTGNKSELAVGYCTLYGDLSGGLAAISDVPKTMVYRLARYINQRSEIIPWDIVNRPPSAELKPDQRDQDTLPPYEVLDRILNQYLEEGHSKEDLVRNGFDAQVVEWIVRAVTKNEYKRRQVPPGLKVTTKAFGSGRRMPIAARYED